MGGSNEDMGISISYDESGNIYVTGISTSSWGSPLNPYNGSDDVFVAKLNSSGELQWHTFLGGSRSDKGFGIAVDGSGNIYITGMSSSTWGIPLNPFSGYVDAFVAKLNANGACSGTLSWAAVVKT